MEEDFLNLIIPGVFTVAPKLNILLRNIELPIPNSGICAVIGSSGSGKSLFFSILTGNKPKAVFTSLRSYILLDGKMLTIKQYAEYLKKNFTVFYINQEYFKALNLNLTVYENIIFLNPKMKNSKIKELFNLFNFPLVNLYSKTSLISGGQLQRLVLMTAFLFDTKKPRLLILDEVTSALDYNNEVTVWETLRLFSQECSIFITTHNLNLAVFFSDRFLLVKDKEIKYLDNYNFSNDISLNNKLNNHTLHITHDEISNKDNINNE